jgi:Icc-related predicted phosphoesterase
MKIAVCSDLHLEFGDIFLKNEEAADVLILGGDIMVANDIGRPDPNNFMEGARSSRYRDFISRCAFEFPHVVFVMGNHEHYHGDFAMSAARLQELCAEFENVHFLDKATVQIQDFTFVGGTLWTDMNREDPDTLGTIARMMNDFRIVANGTKKRRVPLYKKAEDGSYVRNEKTGGYIEEGFKFKDDTAWFSPEDAVVDHKAFLAHLTAELANSADDAKFVVVGHHSPSKRSTHPRYQHETLMNGGYSSDLEDFIITNPKIRLWTHGHTHEDFDYMVGSCRIVCNPRGYINYEARADDFKLKYVDI